MVIKFTKKDAVYCITTLTNPFEFSGIKVNGQKPALPNLAAEIKKIGEQKG